MTLSIAFLILDCLSVTSVISHALPDGLNPFWKLAFVFKCLTDTIILDDFQTALNELRDYKLGRIQATTRGLTDTIDTPLKGGITKTLEVTESREHTSEDKGLSSTIDEVDLERQMQYWIRRGSTSDVTKEGHQY
jgi:hypothetical protein